MAITNTDQGGFSALVSELVLAKAQEELRGRLVHVMPGHYVPGRFVKGTNTIRFARYQDLGADTTPLVEGESPTSQALTIGSDYFTATQYGKTIAVTDLAQLDSPHDLISIASERIARQAAETMDIVVKDVLAAGTNVKYAGDATSRVTVAQGDVITGALVKKMAASLKAANIPAFSDGFYRCIIHPFQEYDLITDTTANGWIESTKYVDNLPLLNGEIGRFAGVRFLVSSNAKVFVDEGADDADVYSAHFFGPDSYTVGDSQTLQAYFVSPGGDHSDPLAQRALAGYKMRFGAKLLDLTGARYVRLETGATLSDE
jgi:N4-gp56 family major capsid protein